VTFRVGIDIHYLAAYHERSMQEPRCHVVEIGVSISAIHDGGKVRMARYRMVRHTQAEIWSVCRSIHFQLVKMVERAAELAFGRERRFKPLHTPEVCILGNILADRRRFAGHLGQPGPELTSGIDLASRDGVSQHRMELGRLVETKILQPQTMYRKFARRLCRLCPQNDDDRIIGAELPDDDWDVLVGDALYLQAPFVK
jgi:hypothetical protein